MRKSDIDILMLDGCTRSEAEKHLERGTVVFDGDDFFENFSLYMQEWGIDEEDQEPYRNMIEKKAPAPDWGIAETDGKTFYIAYCL